VQTRRQFARIALPVEPFIENCAKSYVESVGKTQLATANQRYFSNLEARRLLPLSG
jgi:hypothetical protein